MYFFSQGIYRVNGAKSRVEKLCQAFENGKDLVELSDLSPHDISNVLKLYLRQVCLIFLNNSQGRLLKIRGSLILKYKVKWDISAKEGVKDAFTVIP